MLCSFLLFAALIAAVIDLPQAWAASSTATTLTVTSSGNAVTSVAAGSVVTLTATAASGTTPVTPGQVKFCNASAAHCEDAALLATAQLNPSGIATYKFRPGAGSHSYQAVFVGTGNYTKSVSTTAALTVTPPSIYPTTATIAASGPTGDYSLTATIVGLGSLTASPTGEVSFLDTTNGNTSLGSAALGAATTANIFLTGSTPAVGPDPVSVAVADFNGDGIPDLVTLNYQDSTMTVLLGNADGTYTALTTSNVGSLPESVVAGDFNGDGIPDLAVSNPGDQRTDQDLIILLGNGDGTFTLKSKPLAGLGPTYLAVGDFNGDGILDLATSENDEGTVKVLLGNGDGTFTQGYSTNNEGGPIVAGDFNGDGILDLAVSTGTILLGNGDGTFTPASQTITDFADAAVGDFNGDGISDLAITNNASGASNGTVTILLSKGNGTFTTGSTLTVGYKTGPIAAADFNGDGILDLAAASSGDNTVTVLLGKGNGAFPTQSTVNVGNGPDAITAADFNGDGLSGLATANSGDNTVSVLLSEHTETATATFNDVSVSGSGTQLVEASYPGDSHFSGSVSPALALTTSQTPVTLQLTSSPNPSIVGSDILLTAVLMPSSSITSTTNGETITFYNAAVSIGTGTLSSGVATLSFNPQLVGSAVLTATYPGDSSFESATSNSLPQVVTIATPATTYVVTTNTDRTSGVAADCTTVGSSNCSLRDALAAAAAKGAANITFDPSVFGAPQTITLGSAAGLTIPSDTTINIIGPTTGSGAAHKNLVTVSGGGANTVFSVGASASASISGLTITDGSASVVGGGGILNYGILTISGSTISGNISEAFTTFLTGGGIENYGSMTLADSTVSGNSAGLDLPSGCSSCTMAGGGIDNEGTLLITNSTIVGNTVFVTLGSNLGMTDITGYGGGISSQAGTLTIVDSTVTGNNANGLLPPGNIDDTVSFSSGGISIAEGMSTQTNDIISGNDTNGSEDDCEGSGCGTNGVNGNIVGSNAQLAPSGNYGGPTQTSLPLPGSPAICAGIVANIPANETTDQRGLPRTTTYGSHPPCVDSGSVQTNYALSFSTEPPASVASNTNFAAALQLSENGAPVPVAGISIPLVLGAENPGSLNVISLSTNASGIAGSSTLQVSTPGTSDTLVAALPIMTAPPPPSLTSAITISAVSTPFDVTAAPQTITFPALPSTFTFGISPITLQATASSGLAITYSVTGPASIRGSTLTITGAGTVVVTASQAGNETYSTATPVSQTITVTQASTTTRLTSSASNVNAGTAITFTAAVTSFISVPGGSVQFLDGAAVLGSSPLTAGVASYTTSSLSAGSHTINAVYSGDTNFATSSASLTQLVTGQTINFPALPASVAYGSAAITLKATASSGLPVSYSVTGPASISGSTLTITGAGTVAVTASQAGNGSYAAATPVSQTVTVTQASTATTLASSTANANQGASITFTATVTSTISVIPGGSVQFLDGTTALGSSTLNAQGIATYTTSALSAGSHTINAVYSGDTSFSTSTAAVTQLVTAPAFSLTASPTSLSIAQGHSGHVTVTLTPTGGYTGSLTIACSGAPANATCTLNPSTLTADGSNTAATSTLTIATDGPNHTAGLSSPPSSAGDSTVRFAFLPAGIFAIIIFWQRRRLGIASRYALWIALLLCAGITACGGGGGMTTPTTPIGTSKLTVTASASGGATQSVTVTMSVTN